MSHLGLPMGTPLGGDPSIVLQPDPNLLTAIQRAKLSMQSTTAEGTFLDVIGQNASIARFALISTDEIYRQIIQLLTGQPKSILFTVYKLMEIVLGTQASYITAHKRPWKIYEIRPNEILIEIPNAILQATNETASYAHGWSGYAFVTSGPTDTFTTVGNVASGSATALVGKAIHVNTSPGTWTSYTIAAASYNAGTNVSTIQVSASTIPTGGGYFFVELAGDEVATFRGDFIPTSGFVSTFTTAPGAPTATLLVAGYVVQHLVPRMGGVAGQTVQVTDGPTVISSEVVSVSYDAAANQTIVVIADTVTANTLGQTIIKALEESDGVTTPPHADRVYLTGLGAFEIVKFYMDALVRAAGIVLRVEQI